MTINLTISDESLLAGGYEPAWLGGYGPVTAEHARDLARAALQEARAAVRRLYVAPETAALVAMESRARAFPAALGLFLDLRDQTCRTAWCDAPIRHHDHAVDHADGGPTSAENGQGLCEQCNHTKQAPGWTTRPVDRPGRPVGRSIGPPGTRHQIQTTLPTGHQITTTAPRAPTPGRAIRPRRGGLRLIDHHIDWDAA